MCSGKKCQVDADEEEPELPPCKPLVEHAPGDFREPVADGPQQRKDRAADQHVVQVRDNEIAVVHLQIQWHRAQHDARESADQQDDEEPEHEPHR
jgi:hypothetical protein